MSNKKVFFVFLLLNVMSVITGRYNSVITGRLNDCYCYYCYYYYYYCYYYYYYYMEA
jgi:hypothetical protein